jgi:hypothetical protein
MANRKSQMANGKRQTAAVRAALRCFFDSRFAIRDLQLSNDEW